MNPPKPSDRLSEYVLVEQIGAGTFGQVWKARHHVWPDQIVAIKIPTDANYVRLLRREGQVMHQVDHPGVVRPIGFDPFGDPPYLVMPYVSGGDLRRLLANGPLPVGRAVELIEQVLTALAAAHRAGVCHLDLKPSNILIDAHGRPMLTDFGLGRALMRGDDNSLMQSLSMAAENNSITGTLEYMSPEQRRGQPLDARADLYSVGVLLFEMLVGERPAGNECPSDLRPDAPPWIDEVFRRSYARLAWRYPSAEAMLDDVRRGRRNEPMAALPMAEIIDDLPVAEPIAPPGEAVTAAEPQAALSQPSGSADPAWASGEAGRCSACGRGVQAEDQFCIHCGHQLVAQLRRCPQCGGYPQRHDVHCVLCGTVL